MNLLVLLVMTSLFWLLYHLGSRLVGSNLEPMLAAAFGGLACFVVSLAGYFLLGSSTGRTEISTRGVLFAVLMGAGAALGDTCYLTLYRREVEMSKVGPAILILLNVLLVAAGVLFWRESLALSKVAGVLLAAASLYLLLG